MSIDSAKKLMEEGTLKYGGKYSAPNYEMMDVRVDPDLGVLNIIRHVGVAEHKRVHTVKDVPIPLPAIDGRSGKVPASGAMCDYQQVTGPLIASAARAASTLRVAHLDLHKGSAFAVQVLQVQFRHYVKHRVVVRVLPAAGAVVARHPADDAIFYFKQDVCHLPLLNMRRARVAEHADADARPGAIVN